MTYSLGKRRKSTPMRYGVFETMEKKRSHSKPKVVVHDPSSKCLSSQNESSATKCFKLAAGNSLAMIRAEEVQSSLGTEHPSCIKLMVKAHVDIGYWMGFPQLFGKLFLPKTDTTMVIEDENGDVYHIRYIARKNGLSAGWKKFADWHNLLEGDILVFHLVEPCKFKVYIIRANYLNEVDGALSLLNLEAHTETDAPSSTTQSKRPKSLPLIVVQKKHKLSTPRSQMSNHPIDHSGNDSEEVRSEVLEGSRPSKPDLSFQELKTFEDFRIMVKGTCIDSELPDDVRMNYYKLCNSRKEILHDSLPEGLYYKLVAGMIGETVNIANEIKNLKITTTKEELEVWDNSLKSFNLMGMKVGFLCDRIHMLARIAFESEGRVDIERYTKAKNEQKGFKDEIEKVTERLAELNESHRKMEGIVDGLKQKVGKHEMKFQKEVDAPW
ncbi:B3 domain-containing protein Os01g0234100-like [Cynara cardunculus var. scolymus]|nr:B3 domain-containing protein Os01g0234100-like [Cynara cardunculus var. scolymus]